MNDLLHCLNFTKNYTKIVAPIVNKRLSEYKVYTNRIKMRSIRANALEALGQNKFDVAVASVCTFYPNVDVTLATEVIFSYQTLIQYLNSICIHSSVNTTPFLKIIFSSLKDALNLRTEAFEKYFTFFPSKDDDGYLSILVEKCRQKVLLLPSLDLVRDYIVAYISLYIDLQVTKYSTDELKEINLISWSSFHGQKYPDISSLEYCMAIESSLSLQLLLALATDPDLTEEKVESINNSFFPWVCAIQKILEGYLIFNDNLSTRNTNYIFYYKNLKEYEDRVIYFINKAIENQSLNSNYFTFTLKFLLSIYITDPKANDGMNRLTSRALIRAGGRRMVLFSGVIKVLRAMKHI